MGPSTSIAAVTSSPPSGKGETESLVLGSNPRRGRDYYDKPNGELLHLTNWLDCVRSRQRPNTPAEAGVRAASAHTSAIKPFAPVRWPTGPQVEAMGFQSPDPRFQSGKSRDSRSEGVQLPGLYPLGFAIRTPDSAVFRPTIRSSASEV